MLAAESLDMVMIGSPNHFHYEQLRLALEAGVKVFCEKPVVVSEEQTFGLLELLRRHGANRVVVGLVLRYAPLYVDLLRLAEPMAANSATSSVSMPPSTSIPPTALSSSAIGGAAPNSAAVSCWRSVATIWTCTRAW